MCLRLQALADQERGEVRRRALQGLLAGCADGEWVVRYAVAVGLESLAVGMDPDPEQRRALLAALDGLIDPEREDTPVVRLRAKLACSRLREVR
jgi:phycocyanobilin lyase beta subunit